MLRPLLSLALLVACVGSAAADMITYENSRFGTHATFPVDVFDTIDPPPANGDGRRFRSADGAQLAIYGQFNTLDQTPQTLIEFETGIVEKDGGTVTYSASGKDWAVVSGTRGGDIFYQRHEFSGDGSVIHSMEMRYPMLAPATYDKLVAEIAKTLGGP